jgi:putative oxidoreductase
VAAKKDSTTDIGILVLRIGLALIILYYGSQKVFGPVPFGGRGIQGTLDVWEQVRGIPQWLGIMGIISEFAGGIAILLGLFSRVAGAGIACTMATATFLEFTKPGAAAALTQGQNTVVATYGHPFALMFMALSIVFLGSGRFSLDKRFFGKGR